jgi:hypothetical protein
LAEDSCSLERARSLRRAECHARRTDTEGLDEPEETTDSAHRRERPREEAAQGALSLSSAWPRARGHAKRGKGRLYSRNACRLLARRAALVVRHLVQRVVVLDVCRLEPRWRGLQKQPPLINRCTVSEAAAARTTSASNTSNAAPANLIYFHFYSHCDVTQNIGR